MEGRELWGAPVDLARTQSAPQESVRTILIGRKCACASRKSPMSCTSTATPVRPRLRAVLEKSAGKRRAWKSALRAPMRGQTLPRRGWRTVLPDSLVYLMISNRGTFSLQVPNLHRLHLAGSRQSSSPRPDTSASKWWRIGLALLVSGTHPSGLGIPFSAPALPQCLSIVSSSGRNRIMNAARSMRYARHFKQLARMLMP